MALVNLRRASVVLSSVSAQHGCQKAALTTTSATTDQRHEVRIFEVLTLANILI